MFNSNLSLSYDHWSASSVDLKICLCSRELVSFGKATEVSELMANKSSERGWGRGLQANTSPLTTPILSTYRWCQPPLQQISSVGTLKGIQIIFSFIYHELCITLLIDFRFVRTSDFADSGY